METKTRKSKKKITEVLQDYHLAVASREASLIGRKEVFMGKAKFGIFGDGKEVAQLAMAKVFRNGDWRSGYYRDQTFMLAIGELTIKQYFAQLYAHTSIEADPASAGRMMNGHFGTRYLDENGDYKDLTKLKNSSADVSPTASQMSRLVGLAYASKLFRENPELKKFKKLSNNGNEIAFGTIGNASTSEGVYWESINAAGVLQIPLLMSVWDDDYGISVPKEYHTTRGSISQAQEGMKRTADEKGIEIFKVPGWDYENLCEVYRYAEKIARDEHVPVLVHVHEMTQPQGHSTSGSHERYKSKERLEWEQEFDCIRKMREWIEKEEMATPEELDEIETNAKKEAKDAKNLAWKEFMAEVMKDQNELVGILTQLETESTNKDNVGKVLNNLKETLNPIRSDAIAAARRALWAVRNENPASKQTLRDWIRTQDEINYDRYSSTLYSESPYSALNIEEIKPDYTDESNIVDGREVLQACFDAALSRDPRVFAIGEDLGKIGDVNQAFAGLQDKHGVLRVTDTGIREATIIGQGIGSAMRGLRPITEIQYLDYLIYAIQTLSDDLATLQYRTKGGQKAPLIVRTRGHRLEGIWHSGSQLGMVLNSLRGVYVLVPRDMTRAAGFYNTMLRSDDTCLLIECLNGYRLKEKLPDNIGEMTVPLGVPEVIREGSDITVVTYGSMCRVVMEAAEHLQEHGISCEVIDVQTLIPFDINHSIVESIKKTNRVAFADEDVPGGASAYMMQKVVEEQEAYKFLDSQPITIPGKDHRPAYASDGNYFSKPNVEEVFEKVYVLMNEYDPQRYPSLF